MWPYCGQKKKLNNLSIRSYNRLIHIKGKELKIKLQPHLSCLNNHSNQRWTDMTWVWPGWQKFATFRRGQKWPQKYNMQYIPCNNALHAQETLLLSQKSTFWPQVFQKVRKSRQILISRQSSVCWCLKFLYKSKLFGEAPFCLHTTSATLGLTLTILSFL